MLEINKIYLGDNLELFKQLDDNSIHSCVSDFPYNLSFMGKKWDTIPNYQDWCYKRAVELLRVLKPGGHCLIFGGTRTHHRLVCAFEDAGFEIKDEIMWIHSQGFPKSYNISKGFDKKAGAKREVIGIKQYASPAGNDDNFGIGNRTTNPNKRLLTAPSTNLAKQWDGWGTALKPAHEPIMLAQKPREGTYCDNIEKWGVGGLNIDDSRIELKNEKNPSIARYNSTPQKGNYGWKHVNRGGNFDEQAQKSMEKGRFPANVILDETAGQILDEQSGNRPSGKSNAKAKVGEISKGVTPLRRGNLISRNDSGGASRFFYCPKASKKDRTENGEIENKHPTIKPTDLIKYLIRLITPPNGICIDPCLGSGTHVKACLELNAENYPVNYIGFEKDEESYIIAINREKAVKERLKNI